MTAAAVGKDKKKRQVGTLGDEAAPCRRRPTPWETQTHKPTQTTSVMALHLFSLASLYTMLYSRVDMFLYIYTTSVYYTWYI